MENYHDLALRMRAAARQMREIDSPNPRWMEARNLDWASRDLLNAIRDFQAEFKRIALLNGKTVTYWDLISDREREELERTRAGAPECMNCGQPFKTDADFWKHYVTTDLDAPRATGVCWKKVQKEHP